MVMTESKMGTVHGIDVAVQAFVLAPSSVAHPLLP